MEKANKVGLVFSILAIISVFLPWVSATSSYSAGGFGGGSFSTGGVGGLNITAGVFGALLAGAAAYTCFNRLKQSWMIGAAMLVDAIYCFITMNNLGGKASYSYGGTSASASVKVNPEMGLFLFTISALVILIVTLKDRQEEA